jgi:hypothetical protein
MNHRTTAAVSAPIGHPAAPMRVQRKRTKGWRMPPNTVNVTRPGKWGNPFNFSASGNCWNAIALGCRGDAKGRREAAVKAFEQWVSDPRGRVKEWDFGVVMECKGKTLQLGPRATAGIAPSCEEIREALRGKNLACFCPLDQPCHADVLLRIANAETVYAPQNKVEL